MALNGKILKKKISETTEALNDFWGKILKEGESQGLVKGSWPYCGENKSKGNLLVSLGIASPEEKMEMHSSSDIAKLVDKCVKTNQGLFIGDSAILHGYHLSCLNDDDELEDVSYQYILLYRTNGEKDSNGEKDWQALRFESVASIKANGFLLNHPLHHATPANSKNIRLKVGECTNLFSFVDWALRAFSPDVWSLLHPDLFEVLNEQKEPFSRLFSDEEGKVIFNQQKAEALSEILNEATGGGSTPGWFQELKAWCQVTQRPWSKKAPEFLDMFTDPAVFL